MKKPPTELDGARVLLWAALQEENQKTDTIRLYADGVEQTRFSGLALAQYENTHDTGVYLFYCGQHWEVENDSLYRDIKEAIDEAERQFVGISDKWKTP